MDMCKLGSLAQFGIAAAAMTHMPVLTAYFGSTLTSLGIAGLAIKGMVGLQEKNVVNSIEFCKEEGDHLGKLKINVSTGPLGTSRTLYAEVKDCQAVFSHGEDNLETEANLVEIKSYIDSSNG